MALPNISDIVKEQVDDLKDNFNGFTSDLSSNCDIMGTLGGLTDRFLKTIIDPITGELTTIEVAASEMLDDIRGKLTSSFGGSGGVLNTIIGYIRRGQDLAVEIEAKADQISESVMAQLQALMDNINNVISSVTTSIHSAMVSLRGSLDSINNKLHEVVVGMRLGLCSTINTVLAGTPDDAFDNITAGATNAAAQALGAVKNVFNQGGTSVLDITKKVADDTGMNTIVSNIQDSAAEMVGVAETGIGSIVSAGASLDDISDILATV